VTFPRRGASPIGVTFPRRGAARSGNVFRRRCRACPGSYTLRYDRRCRRGGPCGRPLGDSPKRAPTRGAPTGCRISIDISHRLCYIASLAHQRTCLGGKPGYGSEGGARGRNCNPLPGGFGHQSPGTTDRGARCFAGLGQVSGG
jgi:hypothetical protein